MFFKTLLHRIITPTAAIIIAVTLTLLSSCTSAGALEGTWRVVSVEHTTPTSVPTSPDEDTSGLGAISEMINMAPPTMLFLMSEGQTIEFRSDNTVILHSMSVNYEVLDENRLSIEEAMGANIVYDFAVKGDDLTLDYKSWAMTLERQN